jgi:hypothetical protein
MSIPDETPRGGDDLALLYDALERRLGAELA